MRCVRRLSAALLLFAATACGPTLDPGCTLVASGHGPAGQVPIRVERVASGLEVPWGLAFLPGGDLLVTERPGRIRLVRGGQLEAAPVATVEVSARAESGLLGIAADPRFAENRRFYTYATVEKGSTTVNRVTRWVLAEDGRSARQDRTVLDGVPAARLHDGGRIRFGPDGMLYVATGDATAPSRAQDRASLNGKVLRLTPDGGVPPDNPTAGSPVFLLGVRNVQAFDWLDAETLVVADHGPSGELGRSGHDEVTVARAGANLGWPAAWRCEAEGGVTSPSLVFADATPPGGGSVYRGDAIPAWKGSFLVGTLRSRHLQRVVLSPDGRLAGHEVYLAGDPPAGLGRVRDVVEGPDGAVWVTTSNCDGRGTCPPEKDVVVRIVAQQ
jgi:glucose/arabinose dehydrogenase